MKGYYWGPGVDEGRLLCAMWVMIIYILAWDKQMAGFWWGGVEETLDGISIDMGVWIK